MIIQRAELIGSLKIMADDAIVAAREFKKLTPPQLNKRNSENSWSILECIEHLNRYGEFYLPEIGKRMSAAPKGAGAETYKPGLVGNYFANLMQGHNGKIRKIKTFSNMNPLHSIINVTALDRFIDQVQRLIALLDQAAELDLEKIKTAISISSLIKLRLGDTFRFYTYHITRHIAQARRVQL